MLLLPHGGILFNDALERFLGGEDVEVARDKELLIQPGGGVADAGFLFVRAEDEVCDELRSFDGLLSGVIDDGFFVRGKGGAVVEEGADLALELADGPVGFETFVFGLFVYSCG